MSAQPKPKPPKTPNGTLFSHILSAVIIAYSKTIIFPFIFPPFFYCWELKELCASCNSSIQGGSAVLCYKACRSPRSLHRRASTVQGTLNFHPWILPPIQYRLQPMNQTTTMIGNRKKISGLDLLGLGEKDKTFELDTPVFCGYLFKKLERHVISFPPSRSFILV